MHHKLAVKNYTAKTFSKKQQGLGEAVEAFQCCAQPTADECKKHRQLSDRQTRLTPG